MKVAELIDILKGFNPDLEISITDGYEAACYSTEKLAIEPFEDVDGKWYLDIGIGGNRI